MKAANGENCPAPDGSTLPHPPLVGQQEPSVGPGAAYLVILIARNYLKAVVVVGPSKPLKGVACGGKAGSAGHVKLRPGCKHAHKAVKSGGPGPPQGGDGPRPRAWQPPRAPPTVAEALQRGGPGPRDGNPS